MSSSALKRLPAPMGEKSRLRVALLGGFRVWVDSQLIPDEAWKRRKVQTLVKLLALTSRHCMHREQLMAMLWPEAEIESARNNLRQTLHLARLVLKNAGHSDSGIFTYHNGWLCLTSEGEPWVDVEVFERAAAACYQVDDTSAYKNALVLYTGELLPEDRYEDWVTPRRESLRWLHLSLQTKLGMILEAQGNIEQAIDIFHQVVVADPTAEHAHRALMRLYAYVGLRQQALQQYHRLLKILGSELGLEPDPESRKLYEDILSCRFRIEITAK